MDGTRELDMPTLLVVLLEGGKYDGWLSGERSSGLTTFSPLMSASRTGGSSSNGEGSSCAISRDEE